MRRIVRTIKEKLGIYEFDENYLGPFFVPPSFEAERNGNSPILIWTPEIDAAGYTCQCGVPIKDPKGELTGFVMADDASYETTILYCRNCKRILGVVTYKVASGENILNPTVVAKVREDVASYVEREGIESPSS